MWAGIQAVQELHDFVTAKLGAIEGVVRSETFIILSIKKTAYG